MEADAYLTMSQDAMWAEIVADLDDQGYPFNPLTQSRAQYIAATLNDMAGVSTWSHLRHSFPQLLAGLASELSGQSYSALNYSVAQLLALVGSGAGAPATVSDQNAPFGALTLASAGGFKALDTDGNEVDFVSVDDQTGATRTWSVSSGRLIANGTPGVDDGIVLTCTTAMGVIDVTIDSLADTYSAKDNTEVTAILAVATATVAGKTVKLRRGTYTDIAVSGKSYGTVVTFTSHENTHRAEVSGFDITNSTNVKVTQLYLHDAATTTGSGIVKFVGPVTGVEVTDNEICGILYDHSADYTVTPYAGNSNGITSNSTGGAVSGITIKNNYIHDVEEGATFGTIEGNFEFTGNEVAYTYEDCVKVGRVDPTGTTTKINDNYLHGGLALPTDSGNPHKDAIQFLGSNLTNDWVGIEVYRNIAFCEERGDAQLVFAEDAPSGIFFSGMKVKGNMMLSRSSTHGLKINRAKDCEVIGNTFVHQDPAGGLGNVVTVAVGGDESSGVHKVWNNIAEAFSIAGSPDLRNNITLGLNGVTIAYSAVFDGPTFNPASRAEVLAKYSMKALGPADVDTSGDATRFDAGAVGSGYVTFPSAAPGQSGVALDADYETLPAMVSALILGQSELEYLFNAGSFYRQITQPTPGNGNLIVFYQGAVDAAPVRTVVNATTVGAGSVNPAMAWLSGFLNEMEPGVTFVIGDASVAGTSRYELVDDADTDRKWTDLTAVVDAIEAEVAGPVGAMIECWYNSDAASIATFKNSFWPLYFGRTGADGAFTLGNTNPDAINTSAVFDHCFWDGAAATSDLGRGIFARDDTKWYIVTPMPFLDAPVAPTAELQYFSEDGDRLSEPARATMIALESDTLAQSVDLVVGPSAHISKFGGGSSEIHPDVDDPDGQILLTVPIAINMLRLAGQDIGEPVIESVEVGSAGSYVDVVVDLPNGGTLTTLRAFRSASAPGTPPPHYQDVVGFEIERGSTRRPVYATSETSYSADYRGTVTIQDSGSGSPRKGRVRITPTNAFDSTCSVSYLRGQATAVLLETRDIDAQLYLNMLVEHVPALYDSGALYPLEGIPVRPYQEEIAITVPDVTAPTLSSPVDAADGATAATGSVSTNEGNGTLYWVVSTSGTAPSAAQVKAGQMHTGSAAAASGSQAVSGTGVQTLSPAPSGLTASTAYTIHFMHEDAASNQSSVSSGDGFTTSASGYSPVWVDFDGTNDCLTRSFASGLSDSTGWTVAFLIDGFGADNTLHLIYDEHARSSVRRNTSNKLEIAVRNTSNTLIWQCTTDNTYKDSDGPLQVCISFDGGGSPQGQIYINGASVAFTNTTAPTAGTIDHVRASSTAGIGCIGSSQASKLDGKLAYIGMKTAFTDFSNPTNLAAFWSGGVPVDPVSFTTWDFFFGSTMDAAAWNAGNGLGTMTGWTMNGAVA